MISDLKDVIYIPTIGNDILRGTFDTNGPPFASYYFKKKTDAENWIEFCKKDYPDVKYDLVEYRMNKIT